MTPNIKAVGNVFIPSVKNQDEEDRSIDVGEKKIKKDKMGCVHVHVSEHVSVCWRRRDSHAELSSDCSV